ncbi:oligosaccharide flippase family protein [Chungangia koreensis]|uniref:Oligosaccharide flippase family protein n=1 Tax=Chungangia koreensis TaxID=752657 RepID=A0ABV8X3N0_9LACT
MSSKNNSLVQGTMILTIGLFLSKVLGLIYIAPFYSIVGSENIGLYQYAYVPYNIMLTIAISGAPIAVSKFVSKYNALGDYDASRRLLKSGTLIMLITGFVSFLIMFLMAEPFANLVIEDKDQEFTVEDVATVIRWVSFALIVVPVMSLFRGYFQGNQYMMPTSVSQLVEQIARIVFLLGGAYLAVDILGQSEKTGVSIAVFAAFIGAIAGILVLYYYWRKYKPEFNSLLQGSTSTNYLSYKEIYREILFSTMPYIFVGMANSLYQLVDLTTFNKAMAEIGQAAISDRELGYLNLLTHKLVMIPVMLATGFSMALIPHITKYYTKGEQNPLNRSLDQTFQLLLFLTVPAIIGLTVLSTEFYTLFYEKDANGIEVLAAYAPVALLFSLYPVTAAILQGIDRQKWIVLSTLFGLLLKLALNIPFVTMFETNGAILATAIGYIATIIINIGVIVAAMDYRSKMLTRRMILIGIMNAVMAVVVLIVHLVLIFIDPIDGKFDSFLYILICAGVGAAVYGYMALRTGLAQKLLGDRITRIASKLGF